MPKNFTSENRIKLSDAEIETRLNTLESMISKATTKELPSLNKCFNNLIHEQVRRAMELPKAIKFQVLDTGKPATYEHHPVSKNFDICLFETFEEALTYARMWLGPRMGGSDDGRTGIDLKINIPYPYYGPWNIEIRHV